MYQNKLPESGVQTEVNSNKIKFEPYADLADEAYFRYNANMVYNQDLFGQTGNDKTREAIYSSDQDDDNTESSKNSAIPNFIPRIMVDDEILESINSLNSNRRNIFNIVHNCIKEYANHKGASVKPVNIFFSEG